MLKIIILLTFLISLPSISGEVVGGSTISNTGNLVTPTYNGGPSSWTNAVYQSSLTCWEPGGPGYCGPNPIVNSTTINYSYGLTDIYQQHAIASALPYSGTGLLVKGWNFNYTAKVGNGWDDGRYDYLQSYVNFYDAAGKVKEPWTFVHTNSHNWTNFSFSNTFTNRYTTQDLTSVRFGFIGQDYNNFAGAYGPEIENVSFSLQYQRDPCLNSQLTSPDCPKFMETLNQISSISSTIINPTTITTTMTSPETVSVINTIADPTKTTVEISTTMTNNTVATNATELARTTSPINQTPTNFAITNARTNTTNAQSFALNLIRDNNNRELTITNQTSQRAIQESNNAGNMAIQQAQTIAMQNIDRSLVVPIEQPPQFNVTTAQATNTILVNPSQQNNNIAAIFQPNNTTLSRNIDTTSSIIEQQQQESTQEITLLSPVMQMQQENRQEVSVPIVQATQQLQNNIATNIPNNQVMTSLADLNIPTSNVELQTQQIRQTVDVGNQTQVVDNSIIPSPVSVANINTQPQIIISPIEQSTQTIDIAAVSTPSIEVPIVYQVEEQAQLSSIPIIEPIVQLEQEPNQSIVIPNIEISAPTELEPVTVAIFQPPAPIQVVAEPIVTTNYSLIVQDTYKEEAIELPKQSIVKLDAMSITVLEQPKQEIMLAPPNTQQIATVDSTEQTVQAPIVTTNIAVIVPETVVSTQTVDIPIAKLESNNVIVQQVETPVSNNSFTTDKTNPINDIIENKQLQVAETSQTKQTSTVNKNAQNNELAGEVSIDKIATVPNGFNQYASLVLRDAAFYSPKEIYRGQRNVDNARALRQLASDRLHKDLVDLQYRR